MNKWLLLLIVGCLACSASSTVPEMAASIDGPYRATAVLNDSTWFGAAHASKSVSITNETVCTANRVDISFVTDLPYNGTASQQTITGCLENCVPTQQLVFYRIPLTVGTYNVANLTTCAPSQGAVIYSLLLGGDAIVNTYTSQANRTGWMQITAYDERQNVIEGAFEIELVDRSAKTARFKNGVFKALVR